MDPHVKSYLELIFELNKHYQNPPIVDSYFGPTNIVNKIKSTPPKPLKSLLSFSRQIYSTLNPTDLYLKSQIAALIVFLEQEISRPYDFKTYAGKILEVDVDYVPEEIIQNLKSNLANRLNHPKLLHAKEFLKVFTQSISDLRQKTKKFLDLPQKDEIKIEIYDEKTVAYVVYHGNYKSTVKVNPKIPRSKEAIEKLAMHEFFPGHIANYELREKFSKDNPLANSFVFNTPYASIVEGIGEFAPELLSLNNYQTAYSNLRPCVSNNATLMYFSGTTKQKVADYLKTNAFYTDPEIKQFFNFRTVNKFFAVYSLSYYYGYLLVKENYEKAKKAGREVEFLKFLYQNQISPLALRNFLC